MYCAYILLLSFHRVCLSWFKSRLEIRFESSSLSYYPVVEIVSRAFYTL